MLKVKRKGNLLTLRRGQERGDAVGVTYAAVTIRNPAEPERAWEGEFLVDTGAVDTLVPRQYLEAIGITPRAQRTYVLAGGEEIRMDIAGADIEIMGETTYGTVAFGADSAVPLLGVTVLESLGIEVDPHNETLNKLPATRMRGFRLIRDSR